MDDLDASSLLAIVSHLKTPSDLLHAAQASTALASVCQSQSLWQQMLEEKFDLVVSAPPGLTPCQELPASIKAAAARKEMHSDHPAPAAAAAATEPAAAQPAAGFVRGLDLQQTFKALATRPPPAALRFAAVMTDGGYDGMNGGEVTYWADHAFQPNHWSPHCSDGKANINIIGLLHPHGVPGDEQLSQHRSYLVSRCAAAAAVLFSPPTEAQGVDQAAAALSTWNTAGLERLFMDLYQDLWLNQQESTWGRLLLSGLPQSQWPAEFERMGDTAEAIESNSRHEAYAAVGSMPPDAVKAAVAAAAAAAAGSSGSSLQCMQGQVLRSLCPLHQHGRGAAAEQAHQSPAAAAASREGRDQESGGSIGADSSRQQPLLQQQQQQQGLCDVAQQEQLLQRHMVDKQLLDWFSTPAKTQCTGLVEEVVVSRVGHFTCPVATGAVLLGQHPTLAGSNSGGCGSSGGGCGSNGGSSAGDSAAQMQAALRLKHDPMVSALDSMTSYEQVLQAVASGLLPSPVHHQQQDGVEWCEFAPLTKQQRQQRQQQGLYMRPIVWFRFSTPPPDPEQVQQAGADAEPAPAAADADAAAAVDAHDFADGFEVEDEDSESHLEASAADEASDMALGDADNASGGDGGGDSNSTDGYMSADSHSSYEPPDSPPPVPKAADVYTFLEEQEAEEAAAAAAEAAAAEAAAAEAAAADDVMGEVGLVIDAEDLAFMSGPVFTEAYGQQPLGAVQPAEQQQPQNAPEAAVEHSQQQQHQPSVVANSEQQQQQQQQQQGSGSCASSSSSGGSSSRVQKAAWQQRGIPGLSVVPSLASVCEVGHSNAEPNMLLRMPLFGGPRSGNVVCVKLISCEDRMAEYGDPSEEPNIDVQYVALRGVAVQLDLAAGLQLL